MLNFKLTSSSSDLVQTEFARGEELVKKSGDIIGELSADKTLLRLPGWQLIRSVETASGILIEAKLDSKPSYCPHCDCFSSMLKPNGMTRRRYVKDAPIHGLPVRLCFRVQRYRCQNCGRSSQQPLAGINESRRLTERLEILIQRESFRKSRIMRIDRTIT